MTDLSSASPAKPGPGRPREFDMETVLERAIVAFSGRGYHGASVADLAEATGLAWGSIYKAFGDKHALFLAAFDRYVETSHAALRRRVDTKKSGRERLRDALLFYVESSQGAAGKRGCLSVTVAAELAAYDEYVARRVRKAFLTTEKIVLELARAGQADGSLRRDLDAKACARFLLCFLKGMRLVGTLAPQRADLVAAVEVALHGL
jgi:AcrR family transcriptional regulator